MKKLKEQYKNGFKHDGVYYNLNGINSEKLEMIYNTNPHLHYIFEDEDFDDNKLLELIHSFKSLDETDEEFFDNSIKEISNKNKKRK